MEPLSFFCSGPKIAEVQSSGNAPKEYPLKRLFVIKISGDTLVWIYELTTDLLSGLSLLFDFKFQGADLKIDSRVTVKSEMKIAIDDNQNYVKSASKMQCYS